MTKMTKGFTIAGVVTLVSAAIAVGGIIFGFGGRMATIEANVITVGGTAIEAKEKAETAHLIASVLKEKVDLIYDGLLRQGIVREGK